MTRSGFSKRETGCGRRPLKAEALAGSDRSLLRGGFRCFTYLVVGLLTLGGWCFQASAAQETESVEAARDKYLRTLVRTDDEVTRFIERPWRQGALGRNLGWIYDRDLGWSLIDSIRPDGIDRSRTFYHYEPDGARTSIHFRDRLCRIHSYGDSFTHCDQVSDGETWQEYLAAHLQEPIRNYGVGGYSVYQAYLRMRKVEEVVPAPYIIFNIYDDDHFRNLDAWRSIRGGNRGPVGYPLPHVQVNVARGELIEVPNPAQHPEDLFRLTRFDYVRRTFRDDPMLTIALVAKRRVEPSDEIVQQVAASFGLSASSVHADNDRERIQRLHADASLYATRRVMEMIEAYCRETNRKLLVVLSHSRNGVSETLAGKPRWDRSFLDFLQTRDYPWIDLRDAHVADYAQFKEDIGTYIKRYYIGHYSPAGNFFCAMALKDKVVKWLDPRPLPYRNED